jgi:hypothetical protein
LKYNVLVFDPSKAQLVPEFCSFDISCTSSLSSADSGIFKMENAFIGYERIRHNEDLSRFSQSDKSIGTSQCQVINKNSVHYLIESVEAHASELKKSAQMPVVFPALSWLERTDPEKSYVESEQIVNFDPRVLAHQQFRDARCLEAFSTTFRLALSSAQMSCAVRKSYLKDMEKSGFDASRGLELTPEHHDSPRLPVNLSTEPKIAASDNAMSSDTQMQRGTKSKKYFTQPKRQWGLAEWPTAHAEEKLQWRRKQVREALRRYRERQRAGDAGRKSL